MPPFGKPRFPPPEERPRWYPHLCFAGEPMARGQFREPQPSDYDEIGRRNSALRGIERYCLDRNAEVPPLHEEITVNGGVRRVLFVGRLNGKRFAMGYEVKL